MAIQNYSDYDAVNLAELVSSGQVSPAELLEEAISRAERVNPQINAVVYPWYDHARELALGGLPDGPLHGVPFLLKDLGTYYAGQPISSGSKIFADYVPDHDSEMVIRYKAAGLSIFGRSTSPELGITSTTESQLHGKTRNPWNLEHTAGGSSGGAGAAVVAGVIPAANASDGGGSIRIPASCNGLFGLKPTRARTPSGPDVGEGWAGMSTVHAVSRSVRDSAVLLDATAGPDVGAPYFAPPPERPWTEEVGRDPGTLRIGLIVKPFNDCEIDGDCIQAAEHAAELCRSLGHEVEDAVLEIPDEVQNPLFDIVRPSTKLAIELRAAELGRTPNPEDVEPLTWRMISGEMPSATEYIAATRAVHAIGRIVARWFASGYDIMLTPTMATAPLPLGRLSLDRDDLAAQGTDVQRTVGFTSLFNAAGNPAASIPLHWNDAGLPIGTQFVAPYADEATLFRLGAQLEAVQPWASRKPPVHSDA
jgi:amidase/6-aminohexanoate-cyclic-dimer hydrolase